MKKTLLVLLTLSLPISSFAGIVFKMQIPQPDSISSYLDGDDTDDSINFGGFGSSETGSDVEASCSDGDLSSETVDELNSFQNKYNLDSDGWCSLTDLLLQSLEITSIPDSIGLLTNLTRLKLNNNNLTSLPESLGDLINLTKLEINTNSLESVPDSISNLTNLTLLHAYSNPGNPFTNIDCSVISSCSN